MDDHSIFYAAIRVTSVAPMVLSSTLYGNNKALYLNYVAYHEQLIKDLNQRLSAVKRPVYLFGAHVFAQYLIGFGLDSSRIACLLDNDPNKQGRRLYGTGLMVQSPAVLKDLENPYVILKAGVYNQEIKKDILENINPAVDFLE